MMSRVIVVSNLAVQRLAARLLSSACRSGDAGSSWIVQEERRLGIGDITDLAACEVVRDCGTRPLELRGAFSRHRE